MRLLVFILCLLAVEVNAQPLWRNFFTTNQNPRVTVVAGSNATVQASTIGTDQRIFTVNAVPGAAGAQTNVAVVAPGGAITVATNGPAGGYTEFVISSPAITNGDTRNLQFLGGITNTSAAGFVGNGGQLTNVPFSFWTNYTSNPLDFTNLNGLAYGSGMYGMTSYWGYATAPGVGPIGIFYNGIDTNTVITTNGGSFSGAILDLSASSTAPGSNQLVTASWVRNLFNTGAAYYNCTNIDSGATNADMANQYVYKYQSTIPISDVRTYTTANFLTNNGYVGAVVTTNTFSSLGGTIVVNAYLGHTGGSAAPTLTIKPEIYISSDKTNWYNEVAASPQTIVHNTTNLYQWLVDFPATAATNASGFYVQRRLKVVTTTGSGTRTLSVFVGTNAISGTADAAHLTMQSPTATAGNAYLANNQAFTGSNYFSQALNGTLPPPTNAPTAGTFPMATSSSSAAWQTTAPFSKPTKLLFIGDSITSLSSPPSYAYALTNQFAFNNLIQWSNAAVAGFHLVDLQVSALNGVSAITNNKPALGEDAICFILIGANDIGQDTHGRATNMVYAPSWCDTLEGIFRCVKTNGYKLCAIRVMPSTGWTTNWAKMEVQDYINWRISTSTNNPDWIIRADSLLSDPSNTAIYSDGLHLTAVGSITLAKAVYSAISSAPQTRDSLPTRSSDWSKALLLGGGVQFPARETIPTNYIPASTSASTNWVLINWTNTGPVFVATNTAAAGSFLSITPPGLTNNQVFTGSNYFSQSLNGTFPPPTNAPTAGARIVATSGSSTAWTTGFLTNANYVRPDFDVPYSELTTNAAFAFLTPTNVSTVRYQPSVVMVTNSTSAAIAVTAPANCHTTGTWYITNLTVFSFFNMAGRMTNCIAYPIW